MSDVYPFIAESGLLNWCDAINKNSDFCLSNSFNFTFASSKEKRELLACMKSKLVLRDKKIILT